MSKFELLAPAGDLEKLKMAVLYGANAVFIGGERYSLRSRASNFTIDDIKEGVKFAHEHNAHVHVTCNIVMHESDIEGIRDYLIALDEAHVDAIIVSSPAIMKIAKEYTNLEIHASTQASILNTEAMKFYEKLGVKRIVLAREASLEEIKLIREHTKLDLEVFIHGGMCMSYSGRCMLSNVLTNRDANRGGCAHSCRWKYDIFSNGNKLNNDDGYFAMGSKDLCAISAIPTLMDLNVQSFKIEGRMKSLHYIATVVKSYRMLIDEYEKTGRVSNLDFYAAEVKKGENRLTSTGFLFGNPTTKEQLFDMSTEVPTKEFVGIVLGYDNEKHLAIVEQRNYFLPNSKLELFGYNRDKVISIGQIFNKDFEPLDAARHPKEIIYMECNEPLYPNEILRLC